MSINHTDIYIYIYYRALIHHIPVNPVQGEDQQQSQHFVASVTWQLNWRMGSKGFLLKGKTIRKPRENGDVMLISWDFIGLYGIYPLVMTNISMENHHRNSGCFQYNL